MRNEQGMALVVVTMTLLLLLAVGGALALTTSSEVWIATNYRTSQQARYAAEAAAEWALLDLPAVADDWPALLATHVQSWFVDGVAAGRRALPDGSSIDLGSIVARNAAWQLYAYGPLRGLLASPAGESAGSDFYVILFVAEDPASPDRLKVRSHAFGPRGSHKLIEICVLRGVSGVRVVSWTEVR